MKIYLTSLLLLVSVLSAQAGEADVTNIEVTKGNDDSYQFQVTITHQDEGWKHYADRWDIVAPDGTVLATRTLHHPHVNEQPFTRSLSGVNIPEEISQITIRAHDSVHDYGGKTLSTEIPQ